MKTARNLLGVAGAVMLLACDDARTPTEPAPRASVEGAHATTTTAWPTTAQLQAAGVPPSGIAALAITSTFSTDNQQFTATATANGKFINYYNFQFDLSLHDASLKTLSTVSSPESRTWFMPQVNAVGMHSRALATGGRTCGLIGRARAAGTAGIRVIERVSPYWQTTIASTAPDARQQKCAPPKAEILMSYEGLSGNELSIAVPMGTHADVSLSARNSTITDRGLAKYAWTSNGASVGSGLNTALVAQQSTTVGLNLVQEDGQAASSAGRLTVSHVQCNGVTPITGGCEDAASGDRVPVMGQGQYQAPAGMSGGRAMKTVCDVIFWYEYSGGNWTLVDYEIMSCELVFA